MTTVGTKNRLLAFSLIATLVAFPVGLRAQDDDAAAQKRTGLVWIIVGASVGALGAYWASTSSASVTMTTSNLYLGPTTTNISARSTGRLVGGLSMLGGGGIMIWKGARDRQQASQPSSNLRFRPTASGAEAVFTRVW